MPMSHNTTLGILTLSRSEAHCPGPLARFAINIRNCVLPKEQLQKLVAEVWAMYKHKDKNIRSVNIPLSDSINPQDVRSMLKDGSKPPIPRGSRLTLERLDAMNIGAGFLSEAAKQLFIEVLFKYESAIALDHSKIGLLRPEIKPTVVIYTIPHVTW
jgi:hypothetical protein